MKNILDIKNRSEERRVGREMREKEERKTKSEDIKKRREEFNKLNINDLDSLYFNDKINNKHCINSKKNYDKVPKILFLDKCKL